MSDAPRDPVARWNRAVALAHEDDGPEALAEVLAMSDEEVERQLIEDGVDLKELDARADAAFDAFMEKLELREKPNGEEAQPASTEAGVWALQPTQVLPGRERRYTSARFALITAGTVMCFVLGFLGTRQAPETPQVKVPDAGAAPKQAPIADLQAQARGLRDRARGAYDRGALDECLSELDEARSLDPAGDDTVTVRALRRAAIEALVTEQKKKEK